jgi:hypothetical protein
MGRRLITPPVMLRLNPAFAARCHSPGMPTAYPRPTIDSHLSTGYTGYGWGVAPVPPGRARGITGPTSGPRMERIVRLPLIIGAGIVVLLLAAFIAAPQLRSDAAKMAEQAQEQATLAERALYQYNCNLPELKRLAPPAELKQAELASIAEKAQPKIEPEKKDLAKRLSEIRSQAQKAGLPAPQVDIPVADANGLKRAIAYYEQMLAENEQLLKQAAKDARAAKQSGARVLGVPQVAGMVEYTRASRALAEAAVLRERQQQLQAELLRANSQMRVYQAAQGCAEAMEMTAVVTGLQNDLAEVQKLAADAAARAEKLAAQVSQREQELTPVTAEQNQVRDELLTLESKGFQAGDDASFESYRADYQRLSTRARELQEQEELLRLGGLRGAKFSGDDYQNAEIQGGEPVVSLQMLREEAAAAQAVATRTSKAVTELQQQITAAEKSGQDSQAGAERYAALVKESEAKQAELRPQIEELAKQASEKEDEALKAAADAVSAFRVSQQAADGWMRDARELQSQRDPERVNPRLKMMLDDKAIPAMGSSAEAEALMLTGRIYAQRIEANRSLVDDLNQLQSDAEQPDEAEQAEQTDEAEQTDAAEQADKPEQANKDEQADDATEALEAQIEKDVAEATAKLQNAVKIYEGLVSKVTPSTKWVPQAALAGVHTLLARINPSEAAAHLSDALAKIQECTEGHERSPYVQAYLGFQEHLKQRLEAGTKTESGEKPAEEKQPAESEPAEDENR